jgi:RNA polymerase sigma-70 factor (ECF subfamily)
MSAHGVDLIRRMAGGDRDALARFYDAFAPLAFGLIRRLVGDPDEAADVLQDVFWELWRSAPDYDPGRGTPEAWVTIRARSRGIDRVRAARRRDEMLVREEHDAADPGTPDPGDVVADRYAVHGALATLPSGQREVIELAYLGGLTQSEISTQLRQPLGTVKTRMRLGMERLREVMGAAR